MSDQAELIEALAKLEPATCSKCSHTKAECEKWASRDDGGMFCPEELDQLLRIIAERCWLKDDKQLSGAIAYYLGLEIGQHGDLWSNYPVRFNGGMRRIAEGLTQDGWRAVKEIKVDNLGMRDND